MIKRDAVHPNKKPLRHTMFKKKTLYDRKPRIFHE